MGILRALPVGLLALPLAACVVVPVVDQEEAMNSSCETYTKSMTLRAVDFNPNCSSNNGDCLAAALAVSAGSAIISGSIVLTNNTVHWLEYQGSCSDSYLNAAKQKFLATFSSTKPPPASGQKQ
ncbi:hypothetical protein MIZ01_0635 [Sideroxyarcus emersonii]|uniref:Lipoprotein n=1 Tax=Sideroxyarcus emersonii TaxID=2764705 RepID=A0AAN1X8W8_9PROT|nr:hypothetical protein [Sideroxyarcus emersonii]BCK86869.1 hypothetical protein MIZ01_0635 [Sideroxyarcus emersonii]